MNYRTSNWEILAQVSSETVQMIRKVHNNLGHPSTTLVIKMLREARQRVGFWSQ